MDIQLIKRERRGRTWRSAQVRRELIEEFRMSGEFAATFCAERGIKLGAFYNWLPNRVEVSIPVDSPAELSFVLREAARC